MQKAIQPLNSLTAHDEKRKRNKLPVFLLCLALLTGFFAGAQTADSAATKEQPRPDKISLLVYARFISDAQGNTRVDENIVGNFKLLDLLRLEAGFRQGERPQDADAYYHYKLELQSRYFHNIVRVFARLSNNIINYPSPSYRKTNILFAVEGRYRFSRSFQMNGGIGYLLSWRQDHVPDALPTSSGAQYNSPMYRLSARYIAKNKSFYELTCGTYDVFNPYRLNEPILQVLTEQELSPLSTLVAYLRYQYAMNGLKPLNYFLSVGVRLHLVKG